MVTKETMHLHAYLGDQYRLKKLLKDTTWRLTDLLLGIALFHLGGELVYSTSVTMVFAISMAFLLRMLLGPNGFSVLAVFCLFLYSSSAWVLARLGYIYDPWPSYDLIASSTSTAIKGVGLAYIITMVFFGGWARSLIKTGTDALQTNVEGKNEPNPMIPAILLGVFLLDAVRLFVLVGIGAVFQGERRAFAAELVLASNHNVQIVVMALTFLGVVKCNLRSKAGRWCLAACLSPWIPFLLVGSRKEFVIIVVAIVVARWNDISQRLRAVVLLVLGMLFLLPSLITRGRGLELSMQEFALPQYMQFSVNMGYIPMGTGEGFWSRAWLLVPGPLRLEPIVDFGKAFASLGATTVGVGASPFAEATLAPVAGSIVLSVGLLFSGSVLFATLVSRFFPGAGPLVYSLILFFGRGDFWTQAFYILYLSAAIWILLLLFRANTRSSSRRESSPLGSASISG